MRGIPVNLVIMLKRGHYYRWRADIDVLIPEIDEESRSLALERLHRTGISRFEEMTYPDMTGQRFFLVPDKETSVFPKVSNLSQQIAKTMHEVMKTWLHCDDFLLKEAKAFIAIESDYNLGSIGWLIDFQNCYQGSVT